MTRGLHWFRSDLRLSDNTALNALAERADRWLPVFVLDPRLLGGSRAGAARNRFLLDCLARLARDLASRGVPLLVREGQPDRILPALLDECAASLLSFNSSATPFGRRRDAAAGAAPAATPPADPGRGRRCVAGYGQAGRRGCGGLPADGYGRRCQAPADPLPRGRRAPLCGGSGSPGSGRHLEVVAVSALRGALRPPVLRAGRGDGPRPIQGPVEASASGWTS